MAGHETKPRAQKCMSGHCGTAWQSQYDFPYTSAAALVAVASTRSLTAQPFREKFSWRQVAAAMPLTLQCCGPVNRLPIRNQPTHERLQHQLLTGTRAALHNGLQRLHLQL